MVVASASRYIVPYEGVIQLVVGCLMLNLIFFHIICIISIIKLYLWGVACQRHELTETSN